MLQLKLLDPFVASKITSLIGASANQDHRAKVVHQTRIAMPFGNVRAPPGEPASPLSDLVKTFPKLLARLTAGKEQSRHNIIDQRAWHECIRQHRSTKVELTPVSPTAKGPAQTFTGDVFLTPSIEVRNLPDDR